MMNRRGLCRLLSAIIGLVSVGICFDASAQTERRSRGGATARDRMNAARANNSGVPTSATEAALARTAKEIELREAKVRELDQSRTELQTQILRLQSEAQRLTMELTRQKSAEMAKQQTPVLKWHNCKNRTAREMVDSLEMLTANPMTSVAMIAENQSNTVIVSGRLSSVLAAMEIMAAIDVPATQTPTALKGFRTWKCRSANAEAIRDVCRHVAQGFMIGVDKKTNSIYLKGDELAVDDALALVKFLDKSTPAPAAPAKTTATETPKAAAMTPAVTKLPPPATRTPPPVTARNGEGVRLPLRKAADSESTDPVEKLINELSKLTPEQQEERIKKAPTFIRKRIRERLEAKKSA